MGTSVEAWRPSFGISAGMSRGATPPPPQQRPANQGGPPPGHRRATTTTATELQAPEPCEVLRGPARSTLCGMLCSSLCPRIPTATCQQQLLGPEAISTNRPGYDIVGASTGHGSHDLFLLQPLARFVEKSVTGLGRVQLCAASAHHPRLRPSPNFGPAERSRAQ